MAVRQVSKKLAKCLPLLGPLALTVILLNLAIVDRVEAAAPFRIGSCLRLFQLNFGSAGLKKDATKVLSPNYGELDTTPQAFGYPDHWKYFLLGGGRMHYNFMGHANGGARSSVYRAVNPNPDPGQEPIRILKKYHERKYLEAEFAVMSRLFVASMYSDLGFFIPKVSRSSVDSLTIESTDVVGRGLDDYQNQFKKNPPEISEKTLLRLIKAYNFKVNQLYEYLVANGHGEFVRVSKMGSYNTAWGRKISIAVLEGSLVFLSEFTKEVIEISIRPDQVIVGPLRSNFDSDDPSQIIMTLVDPQ